MVQLPGESWQGRLNPKILLVSPEMDEIEAYWVGNPRTLEKKLAVFEIPKFRGTRVIDNGVKADVYPLTFHFEGANCDLEAEQFYLAAKQTGLWRVQHPVKGEKILQLISATEQVEPITSGNIVTIASQWMEPTDETDIRSVSELLEQIRAEKAELDAAIAAAYAQIKQSRLGQIVEAVNTAKRVASAIQENMDRLNQLVTDVNTVANSIQRGIQAVTAAVAAPFEIAARIQQLISLPMLAVTDFQARFRSLENLVQDTFGLGSENRSSATAAQDSSPEAFNVVKGQELALSTVIGNLAIVGGTSDFNSRAEAIESLQSIVSLFVEITDYLDTKQEVFEGNTADFQYFSQSETFNIAIRIMALTTKLMLRKTFNLTVEKRFTLKEPRTPVYLSMQEYGNTESIDLFIESNNLSGNDVRYLPAGREVVVYL